MSTFLQTSAKTALIALAAGLMAAPAVVHAQDRYDGYCYMRKHDARTNGAVIGAVAGGALGGTVANTHNKGVGTVLGAAVGAAVGANVGADSVKCYNGEYHSFERSNYAPPPPPEGYETIYYHERPDETYYSRVEYQTAPAYGYDNGGYAQNNVQYQGYAPPIRMHRPRRSQPIPTRRPATPSPRPRRLKTTATTAIARTRPSRVSVTKTAIGTAASRAPWAGRTRPATGTKAVSSPTAGATATAIGTKTTNRTAKARARATKTQRADHTGPPISVNTAAHLSRTARAGDLRPTFVTERQRP